MARLPSPGTGGPRHPHTATFQQALGSTTSAQAHLYLALQHLASCACTQPQPHQLWNTARLFLGAARAPRSYFKEWGSADLCALCLCSPHCFPAAREARRGRQARFSSLSLPYAFLLLLLNLFFAGCLLVGSKALTEKQTRPNVFGLRLRSAQQGAGPGLLQDRGRKKSPSPAITRGAFWLIPQGRAATQE